MNAAEARALPVGAHVDVGPLLGKLTPEGIKLTVLSQGPKTTLFEATFFGVRMGTLAFTSGRWPKGFATVAETETWI